MVCQEGERPITSFCTLGAFHLWPPIPQLVVPESQCPAVALGLPSPSLVLKSLFPGYYIFLLCVCFIVLLDAFHDLVFKHLN